MTNSSEEIVKRLQKALEPWGNAIESKKMFGGYCFLYHGKMVVGETKGKLVVRVIASKMEGVLAKPHVAPMDFTGKAMKEFVFVTSGGYATEESLQFWVELGMEHAIKSLA